MSGTLFGLLVLEGLVTLAGVALLLNRGYYDRRETDQLILDSTEHEMENEQKVIRGKVALLSSYIKKVGIAWSLLAAAILVVWVVDVVRGL